jgi:hypothetical protein
MGESLVSDPVPSVDPSLSDVDGLQPYVDQLWTMSGQLQEKLETSKHPWTQTAIREAVAHIQHAATSLKVAKSNTPVTEETPLSQKVKDVSRRNSG